MDNKTLTRKECRDKLSAAVDEVFDDKLQEYQKNVCGPRLLLSQIVQKDIADLKLGQTKLELSNQSIIDRLDRVSANGNPGLENSLKDIYAKLKDLHTDVLGVKMAEAAKWYNMTIVDLFKKKWMKPIWILTALLLVNTILHQFNVKLDMQSIFSSIGK